MSYVEDDSDGIFGVETAVTSTLESRYLHKQKVPSMYLIPDKLREFGIVVPYFSSKLNFLSRQMTRQKINQRFANDVQRGRCRFDVANNMMTMVMAGDAHPSVTGSSHPIYLINRSVCRLPCGTKENKTIMYRCRARARDDGPMA